MTIHRFYIAPEQINGTRIRITGPDAAQIHRVLRLREGAAIAVFDGGGREIAAHIMTVSPSEVTAEAEAVSYPRTEDGRRVILVQALLKGEKTDWVVEKATELGAAGILLFPAGRSVVQLREERSDRKLERWRRIAKEAAEQCGRVRVPGVELLPSLAGALDAAQSAFLLLADEAIPRSDRRPTDDGMDEALGESPVPGDEETSLAVLIGPEGEGASLAVLIGPEGGWMPEERDLALARGARRISLGPRILRAETAALAALVRLTVGGWPGRCGGVSPGTDNSTVT